MAKVDITEQDLDNLVNTLKQQQEHINLIAKGLQAANSRIKELEEQVGGLSFKLWNNS
jgi:hypothetical protein